MSTPGPGGISGRAGDPYEQEHRSPGLKAPGTRADAGVEPEQDPAGADEEVDMSVMDTMERCTRAAAHRRDHSHGRRDGSCRPHAVEVVHLGRFAMVVCHDCGQDTGFGVPLQAERTAAVHRARTGSRDLPLNEG